MGFKGSSSIAVLFMLLSSGLIASDTIGTATDLSEVSEDKISFQATGIPPGPNYNGSVLHVGPGQTYGTIQSALDDSEDRDVIVVHPATYNENLVVDTAVHISGMKGAIIEGHALTAFIVNVDNVSISGMAIKNGSYGIGSYGTGLNITNNVFYHNSYEINVQISNSTLTKDRICYPIVINGNTFDHTTTYNMIDITFSLGSGRKPVNVAIGAVWIGNNNATISMTNPYVLRITQTLSNIWNGTISVDEATFLNNKLIGGGYSITFSSSLLNLQNTTFDLKGYNINYNNLTNMRYRGITSSFSFDRLTGTTKGTISDSFVSNNLITSTSGSYNPIGIQTVPCFVQNSGDRTSLTQGNITLERNRVSLRGQAIYMNMNGMIQTLSGYAKVRLGDISILSNNLTSRANYGIYLPISANGFVNHTSVVLGRIMITDNWISSSSYSIYITPSNMGENLQGQSSFSMAGFGIINNTITSTTTTGLYIYPQRMGKSVSGDSAFKLGLLNITKNLITSSSYGIRARFSDTMTTGSGNGRCAFSGFKAAENTIKSTSSSIYIYSSDVASHLKDDATVEIGGYSVIDNDLTGSEGVNIFISSFGNDLSNGTMMKFSGIEVMQNRIVATGNGVIISTMNNVGSLLKGRSSVNIGDIRVQENNITASTGINIGTIQVIAFNMIDDATCIVGDLAFDENQIDAVNDGIALSTLSSTGRLLRDRASADIGTMSFDHNKITSDHNGIRLGSLSNIVYDLHNESTSVFGGLSIMGNDIGSVEYGISLTQMEGIVCYLSETSKGLMLEFDVSSNTIQTTGYGIFVSSIHYMGCWNSNVSESNVSSIVLIGNSVISQGSIGIAIQVLGDLGSYNSGNSIVRVGGLSIEDNIVRSNSDGIFLNQIQYLGSGNSDGSSVFIDGISIDGNDVKAAVTSIMVVNMQWLASGNTGNAQATIGPITIDGNTLRSAAPGIWIPTIVNALSNEVSTSSSGIDLISLSGNDIRSNMSGIRSDYLEIGSMNNESSKIAMGGMVLDDNNIIASGGGISLSMRIGQIFDEAFAKIGDISVEGNSIETIEGSGISAIFEIDIFHLSILSLKNVIISDNGVHGSNRSAIYLLLDAGVYNSSSMETNGYEMIHNNITDSREGFNFTGVKGATAYLNNFIGNTKDLAMNTSSVTWISQSPKCYRHKMSNFTNYVGNYWDRYGGSDHDDDGIGDTPYDTSYGLDTRPFTSNVDDHFPPWHDITPPSVRIISPEDGAFLNRTGIEVEWEGDDDILGITSYSLRIDDGARIDKGLLTHHTVELNEGVHTIEVTAIDKALNVNVTEITFTVDVTDTSLSFINPADGAYLNTDSIVIEWSGSDSGSGIERYLFSFDEGFTIQKELNTTQSLENLDEGEHSIVVWAYDRAGNIATVDAHFFVDTIQPQISIEVPLEGEYYNESDIKAIWALMDMSPLRSVIELDGGSGIDLGLGTEYLLMNLTEGAHTFTLTVIDPAMNEETATVSFFVDTIDPDVSLLSPGEYVNTTDVPVKIRANGTGSPIGPLYINIDGGARILMDYIDVSGDNISFTLSGFSNGEHAIAIEVNDKAGNRIELSKLFIVDTVSPIILDVHPTGFDVRTDETIRVNFSEVMDEGSVVLGVDVVGGISWEGSMIVLDPDGLLDPDRTYTVSVYGTDLAGNHLRHSWQFKTAQKGTITGSIVDGKGKPLVGATVILDTGETAITDYLGRFTIQTTQGHHTATVTYEGDEVGSFGIDVIAGAISNVGEQEVKLPKEGGKAFAWWILIIVGLMAFMLLVLIAIAALAIRSKAKREVWDEDGGSLEE